MSVYLPGGKLITKLPSSSVIMVCLLVPSTVIVAAGRPTPVDSSSNMPCTPTGSAGVTSAVSSVGAAVGAGAGPSAGTGAGAGVGPGELVVPAAVVGAGGAGAAVSLAVGAGVCGAAGVGVGVAGGATDSGSAAFAEAMVLQRTMSADEIVRLRMGGSDACKLPRAGDNQDSVT